VLFRSINILLHRSSLPALPSDDSLSLLSQSFAKSFSDNIHKLHINLLINVHLLTFLLHLLHLTSHHLLVLPLMRFLLSQSPYTYCDLYPIPTSILKQCPHILLPKITNIINLSLSTGISTEQFKNCYVHPHLKNLTCMDKDDLGHYRPIAHPCFFFIKTQ